MQNNQNYPSNGHVEQIAILSEMSQSELIALSKSLSTQYEKAMSIIGKLNVQIACIQAELDEKCEQWVEMYESLRFRQLENRFTLEALEFNTKSEKHCDLKQTISRKSREEYYLHQQNGLDVEFPPLPAGWEKNAPL